MKKISTHFIINIIIIVCFNIFFWCGSWKMWKGGGNNTSANNKSYVTRPRAHLSIVFIPTPEADCLFLVAVLQVCDGPGCRGDRAARHDAPLQPAGAQSSAFSSRPCQPSPAHHWVHHWVLLGLLPVSRQQHQSASAVHRLDNSGVVVISKILFEKSLENVLIFSVNKEASVLLLKSLNMREKSPLLLHFLESSHFVMSQRAETSWSKFCIPTLKFPSDWFQTNEM